MTTFSELKLSDPIARALAALGYDTPTPIQEQAIPHLIEGRDLLGIAQTGTGKTAAFALPTLHHIFTREIDPPKRGARVLVLAPTRELVGQIHDSFVNYGRYIMDLNVAKVTGGVSIGKQIKRLVHGNDVLVATPGRLIDLLDRKSITLADVEVLILDEADQMMDMGFIHALKKIVPLLPKTRQTLFFSATLPPKIKTLAGQFLTDPIKVTVSPPNSTADRVTQSIIFAKPGEKPMLLADWLLKPEVERALVFTRTKHGADRVVKRLAEAGLPSLAIHGNKSQGQRQRALDAFKDDTVKILVATDVAARGIDIPGITHVFNYEIPNVAEQYIHRIGRTARADAEGHAVAFVAPDEKDYLKDIQKLLGESIPIDTMPDNMGERIKVIKARDAVELVSLTPDTGRKGRGKSGKKKDRSRGKKTNRGAPRAYQSDEGSAPIKSTKTDTPQKREQSSDRPAEPRKSRADGEGYRGRKNAGPRAGGGRSDGAKRSEGDNATSESFKRKPYRKNPTKRANEGGGSKDAAPRSDKPRNDKPRSDKPRSDKPRGDRPAGGKPKNAASRDGAPKTQSADKRGGSSDYKRTTRKAPSRNSGGTRPPKRRSR